MMNYMDLPHQRQAREQIQDLGDVYQVELVDVWEALGQEHRLVESAEWETWSKITHWMRYSSGCSCGSKYPTIRASEAEVRSNFNHLRKHVETHSHAEHLKHLVQLLLDEDLHAGCIPIEQA